jgi:hypothetical protein
LIVGEKIYMSFLQPLVLEIKLFKYFLLLAVIPKHVKDKLLNHFPLNLTQNFKEMDEEGFDEEEKKRKKKLKKEET